MKDFVLRRELKSIIFQSGGTLENLFVRIVFIPLINPGALLLHPWEKEISLLFQLMANAGVICMELILCACIIQDLGVTELPPDFRRRSRKPDNLPLRSSCKAVSMKPNIQWRPCKFGEAGNVGHVRKSKRNDENWPNEWQSRLQSLVVPWRQGHPNPLEFIYCPRFHQMLGMEL